jgi:hypothetical protein
MNTYRIIESGPFPGHHWTLVRTIRDDKDETVSTHFTRSEAVVAKEAWERQDQERGN